MSYLPWISCNAPTGNIDEIFFFKKCFITNFRFCLSGRTSCGTIPSNSTATSNPDGLRNSRKFYRERIPDRFYVTECNPCHLHDMKNNSLCFKRCSKPFYSSYVRRVRNGRFQANIHATFQAHNLSALFRLFLNTCLPFWQVHIISRPPFLTQLCT